MANENTSHAATLTRRAFLAAATTAAATATRPRAARAQEKRMNILLITCDQMRGDALSTLRHPNARTPNLDFLASRGSIFTRCFSNNPVCVPSRITCMTGRRPHEHGVFNNDGPLLNSTGNTLIGAAMDAGYYTGWVGKNHTFTDEVLEDLDGFTERRREPFRKYTSAVPPWWHGNMHWPAEDCYAESNTRDAVEFLKGVPDEKPFFLHVSYFDPHPPYFAPAIATEKYDPEKMILPQSARPSALSKRLDDYARALHYNKMPPQELRETLRHYYASIEWGVDKQVGQVLAGLVSIGRADETIVVFSSDHGDFMGEYGMVRKAMFLYDALLHVPLIIRVPHVDSRISNALTQTADIFPTIAELAGLDLPNGVSGKSLAPIMQGSANAVHDSIIATATYGDLPEDYFNNPEPLHGPGIDRPVHQRVQPATWGQQFRTAALRTQDWKLILNETHDPELYRLAGDIGETRNVYGDLAVRAPVDRWEQQLRDEGAFV